jgi:hypothetical protein
MRTSFASFHVTTVTLTCFPMTVSKAAMISAVVTSQIKPGRWAGTFRQHSRRMGAWTFRPVTARRAQRGDACADNTV